jgi:hypothetical protein
MKPKVKSKKEKVARLNDARVDALSDARVGRARRFVTAVLLLFPFSFFLFPSRSLASPYAIHASDQRIYGMRTL